MVLAALCSLCGTRIDNGKVEFNSWQFSQERFHKSVPNPLIVPTKDRLLQPSILTDIFQKFVLSVFNTIWKNYVRLIWLQTVSFNFGLPLILTLTLCLIFDSAQFIFYFDSARFNFNIDSARFYFDLTWHS